ncbi:transcriptional regulator protein [Arthrobacter sp. Hiyo4]|nr:transcriptional regulator protein [Arthrobacter sp. Hiyo4]
MPETGPVAIDQGRQASLQRQEILLVTERLLAKRGFDGIRLRDVSVAAGVSIGMIQHYFVTRDDLVRETLENSSLRRAENWIQGAAEAGDGPTRVRTLLLDAVADRERCTIWIETCAAASRYEELQALTTRTTNAWRSVLRHAIDAGVAEGDFVPRAPVGRIVDILVGLIDGMMLEVAIRNQDYTPDYINSLLLEVASGQLGAHFDPVAGDTQRRRELSE